MAPVHVIKLYVVSAVKGNATRESLRCDNMTPHRLALAACTVVSALNQVVSVKGKVPWQLCTDLPPTVNNGRPNAAW